MEKYYKEINTPTLSEKLEDIFLNGFGVKIAIIVLLLIISSLFI